MQQVESEHIFRRIGVERTLRNRLTNQKERLILK